MLFLCGLHWGGVAGAVMAWVAPRSPLGLQGWGMRIGAGILGAVLASVLVRVFPQGFLPFYSEGIYDVAENATCVRSVESIRTITPHIGLFLGFLTFEVGRRDWRAVGMMLLIAFGFAAAFSVGGIWQTMHGSELRLDWWKNWEMFIGLGGGLSMGLAFYLFNRPKFGIAQPVTRKERIWGAGFPIWVVIILSLAGAYRGFIEIHKFETDTIIWVLVPVIICMVVSMIYTGFILKTYKNASPLPLSLWACAVVQIIIIVCGFITSIHIPAPLWSVVLLTLYTFYIVTSLFMFLLMLRCRAACDVARKTDF